VLVQRPSEEKNFVEVMQTYGKYWASKNLVELCGKLPGKKNSLSSNLFALLLLSIKNQLNFMRKQIFSVAAAAAMSMAVISCSDTGTTNTTSSDSSKMTTNTTDSSAIGTDASKMNEEPGVMVGGAKMVASKNIVENAAGSADHSTLVTAVKAADLAGTLSGAGPFTVFAPTNEAFTKLPAGTVDNLVKPEMKGDLTKILTYHVVSGALKAADLKDGQKLKTVQGGELTVSIKDGKVMIDGATVTTADVISSNGVTHVIDGVLTPKK
jgi:uncharacterized surface protein with fasciclin (FAS1) repeats